ncbi:MAG: hypothetical protein HY922_05060 [Elusimicrobia bacterium]|nr:hypothetical protein [Elusimicrobiota bacterium]
MKPSKLWKRSHHSPQAPKSASPVDIPELDKKDDKEKKGGASWLGSQAGVPSIVLRGSGAVGSGGSGGFLGSARIAQFLAQSFGKSSWLGALFASQWGSMAVLAGMLSPAIFLLGAMALSLQGLGGDKRDLRSAPMTPVFQGANSVLTNAPMPDNLALAAAANKGLYGEARAEKAADAPAEPAKETTDAPAAPPAPEAPVLPSAQTDAAKAALAKDFTQKMTSGLSAGGGIPNVGKLKDSGIQMQLANSFSKPLASGRMKPLSRSLPIRSQKMVSSKGKAKRAMGQLKLANKLSQTGASSTGEASRQYSTDAFEQQKAAGPPLGGTGITSGNQVVPAGAGEGAPDVTDAPPVNGENQTPYQDQLDDAKQQTNSAMMLMILGGVLIAAGLALIIFAKKLAATGFLSLTAMHYMIMGVALVIAGAGMMAMANMMAGAAKDKGKEIEDKYGQKDQGQIVEECADQALDKSNCKPHKVTPPTSTIKEDVAAERNATYSLQNGGPVEK